MKKGRIIASILLCGMLTTATPAMAANQSTFTPPDIYEYGTPVTIHIDGEYLPTDVDPVIEKGRTLLPMRAAGEALGATITWDGNTRCITVAKDNDLIYFFVGSTTYYVNNETRTTDVAPTIIKDRTMLPLRAFAEALGTRVDWDQYLLDVSISTTGEAAQLPTPAIDTSNDVYRYVQKYYTPSANTSEIFGSWKREDSNYGTPTETYEFFYNTKQGIQNVEIIACYYPYFDFPTINIYKSDTKITDGRYLRFNYQNILYLKDMGHDYIGHTDTEFKMTTNLEETGTLWYAMETDLFEHYEPKTPETYTRF